MFRSATFKCQKHSQLCWVYRDLNENFEKIIHFSELYFVYIVPCYLQPTLIRSSKAKSVIFLKLCFSFTFVIWHYVKECLNTKWQYITKLLQNVRDLHHIIIHNLRSPSFILRSSFELPVQDVMLNACSKHVPSIDFF